jgi:hypothetical protein
MQGVQVQPREHQQRARGAQLRKGALKRAAESPRGRLACVRAKNGPGPVGRVSSSVPSMQGAQVRAHRVPAARSRRLVARRRVQKGRRTPTEPHGTSACAWRARARRQSKQQDTRRKVCQGSSPKSACCAPKPPSSVKTRPNRPQDAPGPHGVHVRAWRARARRLSKQQRARHAGRPGSSPKTA